MSRFPNPADRAVPTGRGEGGDIALVIDRAAEDAIIQEFESLGVPMTVISEERGTVELNGGGRTHVVVDPIDGSRNAKRGTPGFGVSIAVASGPALADLEFGFVQDLVLDEAWHAAAGEGASLNGRPLRPLAGEAGLELLALEMTKPALVARSAGAVAATGAERVRALGSVALALCWVAAGRYDGFATLATCRTVDFAAAQLIVKEAGGAVAIPDVGGDGSLDLSTRTRVFAAPDEAILERLLPIGASD